MAKNLRTLKSCKLLVTVPDISNPFFSLILQGIEDTAQKNGYSVLLGDTQHDERREERYALMLKQKEADGLIFLGHRLPRAAASVVRESAPHCAPIVNGCEFSAELGVPSVHIDNAKAAAEAMDHLYELGHRAHRRGHRTAAQPAQPRSARPARSRRAHAAAAASRTSSSRKATSRSDRAPRRRRACCRVSDPPTAIFCFNDEMAMGVIVAARCRGLRVPDDLSVVGFDDIRFAQCVDPPLTTIAQPMREIGEGTVRLLLEILNGNRIAPVSVTLPHTLQIRASTAPRTLVNAEC